MENADASLLFEGMVCLRALIQSGRRRIEKVFYSETRREKNPKEYAYLCHRAEEGMFKLTVLPKEQIDDMASGGTHGGVLALCTQRNYPAFPESLPEKGFFVLTEGVEDPYNFGYALRSLYAAGADGVILPRLRTGGDGTVCRSSAGASERMEIYVCDPEEAAKRMKAAGYRVICADIPNSVPVYNADLRKPLLLVIGGEKRGVTRPVLAQADEVVRLVYGREFDMALSAASAAAVLAFEVVRQEQKTEGTV